MKKIVAGSLLLAFVVVLFSLVAPQYVAHATGGMDCNQVSDVNPLECSALVDIYDNNTSADWSNYPGWFETLVLSTSDDTVCDWQGVTCRNGSITEVSLTNLALDVIPDSIANITSLSSLQISHTNITQAPSTLSSFALLTSLDLSHNQLTSMPDLQGLGNLEVALFNDNQLTSVIGLGNLTFLHTLTFDNNHLLTIEEGAFDAIPSISTFSIDNNYLTTGGLAESTITFLDTYAPNWQNTQTFENDNILSNVQIGYENNYRLLTIAVDYNLGSGGSVLGNSIIFIFRFNTNTLTPDPANDPNWRFDSTSGYYYYALPTSSFEPSSGTIVFTGTLGGKVNTGYIYPFLFLLSQRRQEYQYDINMENNVTTGTYQRDITSSQFQYCDLMKGIEGKQCRSLLQLATENPGSDLTSFPGWSALLESTPIITTICNWQGISCTSKGRANAIDLSGANISIVSSGFFNGLAELSQLHLSNNQISSLPDELEEIANLELLDLSHNQISSIPSSISLLQGLVSLFLNHNQISSLPSELYTLGSFNVLNILDVSNNQISIIDSSIYDISALTALNVSNNQLTALPVEIGSLANLSSLGFSGNLISYLDAGLFAQIGNTLTSIDASYNYLNRNNLASTETDILDLLQPDWESTQYGVDLDPPGLSDIHIESTNSNDPAIAVFGDEVSLSFFANEELDLNTLTVTIAGQSASASQGDCGPGVFCYLANILIDQYSQQGNAQFTIGYQDLFGNAGLEETATSDSSAVEIESIAPVISAVHIESDNPNTTLASVGNNIFLTFEADEPISAEVFINGHSIVESPIGCGTYCYQAIRTVTGSGEPNDFVNVEIIYYDNYGNTGETINQTSDASSVLLDTIAPTLSNIHIESNRTPSYYARLGDTLTVSFESDEEIDLPNLEPGQGVYINSIQAILSQIACDGYCYEATFLIDQDRSGDEPEIGILVKDITGNPSEEYTSTTDGSYVIVDIINPQHEFVTITSSNVNDNSLAKQGNTITVHFDTSEPIITNSITGDIAGIPVYSAATGTSCNMAFCYDVSVIVQSGTTQGTGTFSIYYTDQVGNVSDNGIISATYNGTYVIIDTIKPILPYVSVSSTNYTGFARIGDTINFTILSSEELSYVYPIFGGITGDHLSFVGVGECGGSANQYCYQGQITIDGNFSEGIQSINIDYADLPGNEGVQFSGTTDGSSITIDNTEPIISNVHIESNNLSSTGFAKSGDIVTVSFKSNEPLDTTRSDGIIYNANMDNLTLPLASFTCSDGFCYSFSTVVDNTTNTLISFRINITDRFGNAHNGVDATTDGSSVTADNTPATPIGKDMYSDNPLSSDIAISGNIITLFIETLEPLKANTISMLIAGQTGTIHVLSGAMASGCLPFYCYLGEIIVSGNSEQGHASLFVQYNDLAGNTTTFTSLETGDSAVYIDTRAPAISDIHLQSNNVTSNQTAKSGDIITLTFKSDEEISLSSFYADINGESISNLTAISCETYCYSGSVIALPYRSDGLASFYLYYTDSYENAGETYSTTDGSSITIDNTLATIYNISAFSTNPNSSFAKSGDTVTVLFQTDEAIATGLSHVTIDGETVNIQKMNCGEFCYSGALVIDNNNSNSTLYLEVDIYDTFGNQSSTGLNYDAITIDTTPVNISQMNISSDNTDPTIAISGDTLTIYFESDEPLISGSIHVLIAGQTGTLQSVDCGGICYTLTTLANEQMAVGNPLFSVTATDLAGNPNNVFTGIYMGISIDGRMPTIDEVSITSSNNTNSTQAVSGDTITLYIRTNKLFDADTISATIAGESVNMIRGCSDTCFEGTIIVDNGTQNGTVDISVSYVDDRGNTSNTMTSTTDSSEVIIDTIAPQIVMASIASSNDNTAIAVEGDDVTLSFETDEQIDLTSANVTIGGQTATLEEASCGGICYTATVTIDSNFSDGELDISISYSDLFGNSGVTHISTTDSSSVQVVREAPTLTYVHIASNNANNTSLAKSGDNIILSFTGSEQLDINNINVDINGQQASIATGSCGSHCYTATAQVSQAFSNPVSFTIDYTNMIGVSGTQFTTVTDGSSVTIDNQIPALLSANIRSSNSQTGVARSGDTIMVSFTTDEILLTGSISLSIANKSGSVVRMSNCPGFCYSGSIVVDSTTTSGTVALAVSYKDAAGNTGGTITETTDSSSVSIDASVPTLSNIFIFSNNIYSTGAKSGDKITLLFTASEALMTGSLSGLIAGRSANLQRMSCDGFCYSGSITVDGTTNNGIAGIRISYADLAGNIGAVRTAVTSGTVNIDTQKPLLDTIHIGTDNTNPTIGENGDTITLTFRSNEQLNMSTLAVSLGGQSASVSQTVCESYCYTAELEIDNNVSAGAISIAISYQDLMGNIGDIRTATTDASSVTISTCAGVLDISENECKTIVNFATALSGTTVANMSGWSQAWGTNAISNICDWQGISCAGGHIVGIDLSANNLSSLPSSIASLPYLTAVDISTNNFSTLPTTILNISNLEFFSIAHNELITIPGNTLSSLSNLNVLDVSYNHLARAVIASTELDIMDTYQVNWEDTQTILSDSRLNSIVLSPTSGTQMTGSTLTLGARYSQGEASASFTGSLRVDIGTGMISASNNNGWTSLGSGIYTYTILPSSSAQNDATILFTGAFVIDTTTGVIYDFTFTLWSGYDSDHSNNTLTGTYAWIDTILPERANVATGKDGASPTFNLNTRPILTAESQSKPIETGNEPIPDRGNMGTNPSPASVYRWAHDNGVTTMPLSRARLYVPVQRYEAATMIVNYVKNVAQQEIEPRSECNIYAYQDIDESINESVRSVIQDICNLGLMGRGSTANTLTPSFRPYDTLSTNELQIILKRYDETSRLRIIKNRRIDVMDLLMRTLK